MEAQQTSGDTRNGVMPSADFSAGTGVSEDEEDRKAEKWTVGVMDGSETEVKQTERGKKKTNCSSWTYVLIMVCLIDFFV
jgi:hypothetical protein